MTLLDGKKLSTDFKSEIAAEVKQMRKVPHLAAILVGSDGASETYVASKVKTCEELGFKSSLIRFENTVSETELLNKIQEINRNEIGRAHV